MVFYIFWGNINKILREETEKEIKKLLQEVEIKK